MDVNILVAWGWSDHFDHERVAAWIAAVKKQAGTRLMTSAIPQLGFVRVSVQRTGGQVSVGDASGMLDGMLSSLGPSHVFLPDDRPATDFPEWCVHTPRTTDAHLMQLAEAHGAELATLDTGIPGAFVLPAKA